MFFSFDFAFLATLSGIPFLFVLPFYPLGRAHSRQQQSADRPKRKDASRKLLGLSGSRACPYRSEEGGEGQTLVIGPPAILGRFWLPRGVQEGIKKSIKKRSPKRAPPGSPRRAPGSPKRAPRSPKRAKKVPKRLPKWSPKSIFLGFG